MLSNPRPGQRYVKNGIEFTVHFVENGQVYGVKYRHPADDEAIAAALDRGDEPPGLIGLVRITIEEFQREIEGAGAR